MAGTMRNDGSSSSRGNSRGESVVLDCGRRKSSCGYCRSPGRTSVSHGPSFFLFNHICLWLLNCQVSECFLFTCLVNLVIVVKFWGRTRIYWILVKLLVNFNTKALLILLKFEVYYEN